MNASKTRPSESVMADFLVETKNKMLAALCDPCRKSAEFRRLNSQQIVIECCSDCYAKLEQLGYIDPL